jgi:hypothetical protein
MSDSKTIEDFLCRDVINIILKYTSYFDILNSFFPEYYQKKLYNERLKKYKSSYLIEYKIEGFLHRDNKPAQILNYGGDTCIFKYYFKGQLHNKSGAHAYKSKKLRVCYKHGLVHCDEDSLIPSWRCKNDAGYIEKEWRVNGILHRNNDLPAVEEYDRNEWHFQGKLHRIGKPAIITNTFAEYWIDGKFIKKIEIIS